jgi:integrase
LYSEHVDMVQMATPWRHPQTGSYYIRRQIPEPLRHCFGGKAIWQVSLKTKDLDAAKSLFAIANAELEQRFADARAALSQELSPERAQELVTAWLREPELKWPRGARLLWELEERAHLELGLPPPGMIRRQEGDNAGWEEPQVAGEGYLNPGDLWDNLVSSPPRDRWRHLLDGFLAELRQAKALHPAAGSLPGIDEPLADALAQALSAYGGPVGRTARKRPRGGNLRLRPQMRLMELFDEWKATNKPSAQTASEFEASARDFVDFIGDIAVVEIAASDLADYRDTAAGLPKSMPRADRQLTFTERVRKHGDSKASGRITPATLKKRVGAIQALLAFAADKLWVARNEGAGLKIEGYTRTGRKRDPYQDHELKQLFESDLFLNRNALRWSSSISSATLYWLFLLGLTSGARIEEVGQCLLSDVKRSARIVYLDVDDYVDPELENEHAKSLKTASSRRMVPVHDHVLSLGFEDYVERLRSAGETRLFPDLKPNTFDKLTKEASRLANRYIDGVGLRDPRLVFHSLRHTFKDLARDAGIPDRIIDQICGHAPITEGGRYGRGARLSKVHKELNRVPFEAIDWALLQGAAATGSWRSESEPQ